MNILYAASEVYPLIKTGGLADVAGSLPKAFFDEGHEVRIVMPAYLDTLESIGKPRSVASLTTHFGEVEILQTSLPGTEVVVLLVNAPEYFARPGNPYLDADGNEWSDNAERFCLFCQAVVELAQDRLGLDWKTDIVHCNDWQTGLVPALLHAEPSRPATVFTIHNLAYQGLFPYSEFDKLGLPDSLWSIDALEFHGQVSFIKGGLVYADHITTVSPNYASEIQTTEFGCGLQGLLSFRKNQLSGILNGIDLAAWDPQTDPHLTHHYSVETLELKSENKDALQEEFSLSSDRSKPLIGMIGRLVEQKGIDLVIEGMEKLLELDIQLICLGTGAAEYEKELLALAEKYPEQIGVKIGFSEKLAHQIEAGADIFLMPSRFEPCGLNQMYSLRYGTIPVVRKTGGLADTVIDATPEHILENIATGIVFADSTTDALIRAVNWSVVLYRQEALWKRLQFNAMQQNFSWQNSAISYLDLFKSLLEQTRSQ